MRTISGVVSADMVPRLLPFVDEDISVARKRAIAALRNGLDKVGVLGVVVQRLPEFADRCSEATVEVNEGVAWPQTSSKLLATDDFSGVFQKHEEEPIGLLLVLYLSPVLQEPRRVGVYLKRAESIDGSWMCLHTWVPQAVKERRGIESNTAIPRFTRNRYLPERHEFSS